MRGLFFELYRETKLHKATLKAAAQFILQSQHTDKGISQGITYSELTATFKCICDDLITDVLLFAEAHFTVQRILLVTAAHTLAMRQALSIHSHGT